MFIGNSKRTTTKRIKENMSYHLKEIPKGVLGEFSKIHEEIEELESSDNLWII